MEESFFKLVIQNIPKPVKGEENPMEVNGKAQSDMVPIHIAGTSEIAGPDEPRPRHKCRKLVCTILYSCKI